MGIHKRNDNNLIFSSHLNQQPAPLPAQESLVSSALQEKWSSDDSSEIDISAIADDIIQLKRSRRRSVSFSTDVKVHSIIHRHDMSHEEILNAWSNRQERKQSRTAIENTVYLMKTGVGYKLSDEDFVCPRGLEHFWEKGTEYDAVVKKSHKVALAMQRILRRSGATSPEMIARAYRKYTITSRRMAYQKAQDDRLAASST